MFYNVFLLGVKNAIIRRGKYASTIYFWHSSLPDIFLYTNPSPSGKQDSNITQRNWAIHLRFLFIMKKAGQA